MRRTLLATLFVLAAAAVGAAQTAPPSGGTQAPAAAAVTVDQILERYVQALGGRAALEKISTRTIRGSYEIAGTPLKGEHEGYSKAPNMITLTTVLPGVGVNRNGYDGQTAWAQDPVDGLRELKGGELAMMKFDAEFNRELKLKRLLTQLELKGAEKVGGREAHVVVGTPEGLAPMKMYFDKLSGLLLRTDMAWDTPRGKMAFEVYYDDYREVDGVKLPFSQRWQAPNFVAVIKFTSVRHNEAVEDAKFKKPSP